MRQAELPTPIRVQAPFYAVKRFIARGLCHPLIGRSISMMFGDRIPSNGCVINTSSKAIVPSVKAALFWGFYESAEVRLVKAYLRKDLDVIELGSSLGVISCHILRKLEPACRLVCVEANPDLLLPLQENINQNCKGKRATVVHGAITSGSDGMALVNLTLAEDNTASHIALDDSLKEAVRVPALTLSNVLRDKRIEGDFALVSDIEGAEVNFIENDEGALRKCQQMIIELHESRWNGSVLTVNELRHALEQLHGFRLGSHYGPVCVFERSL
jgi:FkbM family methyltransferase